MHVIHFYAYSRVNYYGAFPMWSSCWFFFCFGCAFFLVLLIVGGFAVQRERSYKKNVARAHVRHYHNTSSKKVSHETAILYTKQVSRKNHVLVVQGLQPQYGRVYISTS